MRPAPRTKHYQILMVEDNPADVRLLQEAMSESCIDNTVIAVPDGEEALRFLYRKDKYLDAPRPDVIFLDLNLPRKDGREVLAEIKGHPELRRIPVIILTMSDAEQDIVKSYNLHANCYVKKPVDVDIFFATVQACHSYWMGTVRLPPN